MLKEMRTSVATKISIPLALSACIVMLLSGCTSKTETNTVQHDGQNLAVKFALPLALSELSIDGLSANVLLKKEGSSDSPVPIEMDVDTINNTVSKEIRDVETGTYQLIITYFVFESQIQVNLAVVVINDVNVIENGITVVDVNDLDLNRNIDDDGDGYTNLAEIRIGTLALDKFSSPGGESPLFVVSNGSFGQSASDNYKIKHSLGDSVRGTSQSTNYTIVSGFVDF